MCARVCVCYLDTECELYEFLYAIVHDINVEMINQYYKKKNLMILNDP